MTRPDHRQACALAIAILALAGVALRMQDTLQDPVIAAEDPYTHMAYVREHLRDGSVDPLNPRGDAYPPGMHTLLAALWAASGGDLEHLFRFGPPVLGGIGILGVALLLWRTAGPLPAVFGALAMAVLPEAVFRTGMMAPTALDLALLPFLLLAVVETLQGRLAWALPAAALSAFLLFSHPWVFAILAPTGLTFLVLALAAPWRSTPRTVPLSARGLAVVTALLATSGSLALGGCGGACGPGFRDILPDADDLATTAPATFALGMVAAAALWFGARRLQPRLDAMAARPPGRTRAIAVAAVLACAVAAVAVPAALAGFPDAVDPVHMVGLPILALGAVALVALPFQPSPGTHAGAALALSTLPFVLHDPFASPFWSHRTAVYLGLGLAILAGGVGSLVSRLSLPARPASRRIAAAAVLPLLVTGALAAGVYAGTSPYEGGWYRLYDACQMEALREIALEADKDPETLVVTGSWQAKIVLAALATNASRVWFASDYYGSEAVRAGLRHRTTIAVDEPHLSEVSPKADLAFLAGPGWTPMGHWCPAPSAPSIAAYLHKPGDPA